MPTQQPTGAAQRCQTALSIFTAYILLQLFYTVSRGRISSLVGRRAAPPVTGTVATLATLSVWLAWKAPKVQQALPGLDFVTSAVTSRASAALSAGRSSVLHGVESAREYLDNRKAALDETLQAALEKRVAHLVDIFAVRVQGAMIDRDMPVFVQRLLQDTLRRVMPDVKQHMFRTTNKILITPVKRLRIGPLFLPTPDSSRGSEGGLEEDLLPPFKPCIPWPQLRAAVLYLMWPADRSVWRSARSKRWWAAQCLGIVPVLGQLWWLLLFLAKDKTDEHQLADFIVGFESSKFLATGVWSVMYGAMRQHLCLHVIPPGATVWGAVTRVWGAASFLVAWVYFLLLGVCRILPQLVWTAVQHPLQWTPEVLSARNDLNVPPSPGALAEPVTWSYPHLTNVRTEDSRWSYPHLTNVGAVDSRGVIHLLQQPAPAPVSPAHSCMTWGPSLSWLDAVFFLLQLVLVALAFGMLPWSRRRYVHSARAREAQEARGGTSHAAAHSAPAVQQAAASDGRATPRPIDISSDAAPPSTAARSVRFAEPSLPATPTSQRSPRGAWGAESPSSEEGHERRLHSDPSEAAAGGGEGPPRGCCCQRSGGPCVLAGCACSYALCARAVLHGVATQRACCVRRVSLWGLPRDSLRQNGGELRPGTRTVSLKDRGGYLAATQVYFLGSTGVTLLLGAAAFAQYAVTSLPHEHAVWQLQSSLYWVRAFFGVLSMPYIVFRVPLLMQLLVCAQRTAYDHSGNTVLAGGRSEFLQTPHAQSSTQPGDSRPQQPAGHGASPLQPDEHNASASSTKVAPRTAAAVDASGQTQGVSSTLLAAMRRHTPPQGSTGRSTPPPPLTLPPLAPEAPTGQVSTPVQQGMAHVRRQVHSASQWLSGLPVSRQQRWQAAASAPPPRPGNA